MDSFIRTIGLTKKFKQPRKIYGYFFDLSMSKKTILAVNNVNIQVKRGEIFSLIGPNGAGKTTLIKLLCCLILPTKGTAEVAGYNILKEEKGVKESIGLVNSDERSFYWRLTGRQNLKFFASLYNLSSKKSKQKIQELASLLNIENVLDNRFDSYSTGTKQKIGIMRSLLNNSQILFMDEPTKSLDLCTAQNLRNFIKNKLSRELGKTIFFASHNLDEVQRISDTLAIMDRGQIKAYGTIDGLRRQIGKLNFTLEEILKYYTIQQ